MRVFALFIFTSIALSSHAQYVISQGENEIRFSSLIIGFYNHEFYPDQVQDRPNNRFRLRDARFKLDGNLSDNANFELEADFANIIEEGQSGDRSILLDAWVNYQTFVDIKFGFQDIPYSRESSISIRWNPFFNRSTAIGEAVNRRDLGVTLHKDFFNEKLKAWVGAYNGLGVLRNLNDASGRLEYVARVEFSYPQAYNDRILDLYNSAIPVVSIGANTRYANKSTEDPDYPILIDGKRFQYGLDFAFRYGGFSFIYEYQHITATPNAGTTWALDENGQFQAPGHILYVSQFIPKWKSVFALRWDKFQKNTVSNSLPEERLALSYNYLISDYDIVLRLNYLRNMNSITTTNLGYDQMRIGLLFTIN
jgi:hypothetical protein